MSQLRKLKKEKNEHIEFIKKLNSKDELTEAEDKELETRWSQAKALEKRIQVAEDLEKAELAKQDIVPPKEKRSYSLLKAIGCIKKPEGYEAEVSQELEKRGAGSGMGFLVPTKELFGSPKTKAEKRIVTSPQTALVDDPSREELFLPALYEASIAGMLGIKQISATGSYRFPVGSKISAGWISGDAWPCSKRQIVRARLLPSLQ